MYAILDSVSCTGAYEFEIHPGDNTVADVTAELFFREPAQVHASDTNARPVQTIGLAPMSSMFWIGKSSERKYDDYRPEVHDTDGLLAKMDGGEILWRPLDDPAVMRHQVFHAQNIRGFGLLQRERSFAAYQDTFNFYQQVPSVWVEPRNDWGDGDLHLVELSTGYEGLDNIAVFWDPKNKPAPLQRYRFRYRLYFQGAAADVKLSENRAVSTRIGLDSHFENTRQFVIDFAGPKIAAVPESDPPVAIANCSSQRRHRGQFRPVQSVHQRLAGDFENAAQARQHRPGGPALHAAKGNQHFERDLDLPMEPAVNGMKTFNIQHSTSNAQLTFIRQSIGCWALNVQCSMFPFNPP